MDLLKDECNFRIVWTSTSVAPDVSSSVRILNQTILTSEIEATADTSVQRDHWFGISLRILYICGLGTGRVRSLIIIEPTKVLTILRSSSL